MALLLFLRASRRARTVHCREISTNRKNRETVMNAPRSESPSRQRPTQTLWPRVQQPPIAVQPSRTAEAHADEKREEEPAEHEPGYGHGV